MRERRPASRDDRAATASTAVSARCVSCGSDRIEPVYELTGIPAQSAILLESDEESARFPTGDLILTWCADCGLAFNAAFDPTRVEYGIGYEESQGASPTFQRFARELAERWICRYELHGKRAVEIGCGKGEFLSLFVSLSGGDALGLDPAWQPDRMPTAPRLRFELRRFDRRDMPLRADIVICRHTLEHIHDVAGFVRLLRAACDGTEPVVAIEVPDFRRVLTDIAFWDIYYEHATYFTAGAMARLFARAGFEVLDIDRVYGNQYLVLEARPARSPRIALPAMAEDLMETTIGVARFRSAVTAAIARWRDRFQEWAHNGSIVVLWGSGSKAVGFLTGVGDAACVSAIVDINPHRHGRFMPGCTAPIVGPDALTRIAPDVVVVMNPIYRHEIARALHAGGHASLIVTTSEISEESCA
jgi:hypothetical protein